MGRITTLAVRDEDAERAALAVERLIVRTGRNSAGGWVCFPADEVASLAKDILKLVAGMKIGCSIGIRPEHGTEETKAK